MKRTGLWVMSQLLVGMTLGWEVWARSLAVTGKVEPWDSPTSYYRLTVLAAGLVSSLGRWPQFFWGPVGVCVGQVAYMELVYAPGSVILPSLLAVPLFGGGPAFVGGLLGGVVGYVLTRLIQIRKTLGRRGGLGR